ncbi:8-oxo-dGTP diphosphatase MutT [Vibrio tapetis subsp. quintayensis]|uniref:8-oxo-dGTP diphosphatase MutT n=1 Tax=Vibrio tapetis TaxID=52443 RepID=UPI0025B2F6D4|nr:8-oxo-dGTP diphosphatase MutT [Vibrio tapetis]MDN3681540.1 8-oxo-dGTP diphosphatase MutT [Vibrio tapetis subsp. quintayensis]
MKRIHIAAGVIFNLEKTQVYITKRPEKAHKGGLWEFPGGKVEDGENASDAAVRELFEEIGIEVTQLALFQHLQHDYSDKSLEFDFFVVTEFKHQPYGKEGQLGQWVDIHQLTDFEFPEANIPVLNKVLEEYGGKA